MPRLSNPSRGNRIRIMPSGGYKHHFSTAAPLHNHVASQAGSNLAIFASTVVQANTTCSEDGFFIGSLGVENKVERDAK